MNLQMCWRCGAGGAVWTMHLDGVAATAHHQGWAESTWRLNRQQQQRRHGGGGWIGRGTECCLATCRRAPGAVCCWRSGAGVATASVVHWGGLTAAQQQFASNVFVTLPQ
jgi:hypothetical protein